MMGELLAYPQRNRMFSLLVQHRTGMGKAMILQNFCRSYPRHAALEEG